MRPEIERVFAKSREPESSTGRSTLRALHGDRLVCERIDVRDEASIEAGAKRVGEATPRVHWLVNCAGVLHGDGLRPEKRLEVRVSGGFSAASKSAPLRPRARSHSGAAPRWNEASIRAMLR